MLGGMALKWRWKARQKAAGKPTDSPNLVMGANVQVVWEKFARYWEVEPRYVPLAPGRLHLTADEAIKYCDENTIGVVAILGSTFDGSFEPVAEIAAALDQLQKDKGWDIPVHVDCGLRRVRRAVHRSGPGVGLPAGAGEVDQLVAVTSTASCTPASAG